MRTLQERLKFTRESVVEDYLVQGVKARKGFALKLRFMRGWPDRIVLLPGGVFFFVELKRPVGGKFEPLQERIHDKIRALGFKVYVCNTKSSVNDIFALY